MQAIASVKGLKGLILFDDKGFPRAFNVLDDLKTRTGDVPLIVSTGFREFAEKLQKHELPGGVLYNVYGVESAAVANRCMEKVRAYRV